MTQFTRLKLSAAMQKTLDSLKYSQMTDIQSQALPHVLNHQDIIGLAKTGSGKTTVFSIGILEKLNTDTKTIQGLVLCPTRELALQICAEIRRLARLMPNVRVLNITGGYTMQTQIKTLQNGAHIIVGTPGRILDHIQRGTLKFQHCQTLVLDEADRMLDMGFEDDMNAIIKELPSKRQTSLFSATFPDDIRQVSERFQKKPQYINVCENEINTDITELFYEVKKHEKNKTLIALLQHYKPQSVIVFCNTRAQCRDLQTYLAEHQFAASAMHGDLEQRERDQILLQFANNSLTILIATDVAARGINIEDVALVINYEVSRDAKTHVHRVGRTGRAGKSGLAVSLYLKSEQYKLNQIAEVQNQPVRCDVPESLDPDTAFKLAPLFKTLCIKAGRKQKLRPGDIVGALTGEIGLKKEAIGKIQISDYYSYVAIQAKLAKSVCNTLNNGKIKNKKFQVYLVK